MGGVCYGGRGEGVKPGTNARDQNPGPIYVPESRDLPFLTFRSHIYELLHIFPNNVATCN